MRVAYVGHEALTFTDYIDLETGQTLRAEPGGATTSPPCPGGSSPRSPGPGSCRRRAVEPAALWPAEPDAIPEPETAPDPEPAPEPEQEPAEG